ncbi:hypothetical protein DL769_006601 [Monosporascus sp. CRB-8-3]|nr:hypothetical protein DL769_006601 [Monosporascus sp. CRB-8-3]
MEWSRASRPSDAAVTSNRMADVKEEDSEDELGSSDDPLQERFGDEPNGRCIGLGMGGPALYSEDRVTRIVRPKMTVVSGSGWAYSASLGDGKSRRKRRRLNQEESKRELEGEEEPEETLISSNSNLEDWETLTGSDDDSEVEEADTRRVDSRFHSLQSACLPNASSTKLHHTHEKTARNWTAVNDPMQADEAARNKFFCSFG